MTPWHTGTVEVNELTIHYTRTGGAKPPLALEIVQDFLAV